MPQANKKRKILLIGWDAADWKVINPLMDAGLMPTLNSLVNQSVIGNLATLDPPLSPMLWTSIATGKRPYKHGIHGFVEDAGDGKTIRPITIRNRKCKALWNILSEKNYKTHVIGWWPSHPAENINGISISNFFQRAFRPINEPWPMSQGTVSPEEKAELFAQMRVHPAELTENHIGVFIPDLAKVNEKHKEAIENLSRIIADNASIHAAATYILEYEDWDFLAVYYDGIDHFNHGFMKYHPPRRPFIDEEEYELYKNVVTAGYRFHDGMLKRLLQLAGNDCTVLLISDHGFHPDHQRREFIPEDFAGPAVEHSQYGIFCMKGEGIRKDEIIYGASLLDITPTLLNLLDLPVGQDMDGKVLTAIFEEEKNQAFIPTWDENCQSSIPAQTDEADAEMIKQLVDLGYIEKPAISEEKPARRIIRNNDFFLARAYIDGNMFGEAITILERLFSEELYEIRFAASLCNCYQKLLQYEKLDATISIYKNALVAAHEKRRVKAAETNEIIPEFKVPDSLIAMEATSLMSQFKAKEALKIFKSISNFKGAGKLYLKMGVCYTMLKDFTGAIEEFEKELNYNYDEPEAHHGIGYCLLMQKKFDESIEFFLNAVGLRFNYPVAHFHLAEAFFHKEQFEDAKRAYEVCLKMEPGMNRARMRIAKILDEHLDQKDAAQNILDQIHSNISETIYIVSGLPRSGTSLMMQMLSAGGLEVFSDGKRMADESNPRGYFEHEAVLRIKRDTEWLKQSVNKVVKIISPLLTSLPPRFYYKIIFMERDIMEVMASQQIMLKNIGKIEETKFSMNLMEKFKENLQKISEWEKTNKANVEILRIPYGYLVGNPEKYVGAIKSFIGLELDESKMVEVVDGRLHRVRGNG